MCQFECSTGYPNRILKGLQFTQKISRLRCLLRVKRLVICLYLGGSGSILQIRTNISNKSGFKVMATYLQQYYNFEHTFIHCFCFVQRELNCCNDYLSLLYFCWQQIDLQGKIPIQGIFSFNLAKKVIKWSTIYSILV